MLGIRTGDKGRGRGGEELPNFEPGSDLRARVTVLCEGSQGYLTRAALERFELGGESPQTWELGVKEVWRVPGGLDRVIHTLGWPLRPGASFREFGGTFVYPMGDDLLTIGIVVGLDYRDSALSVHDLLQVAKTHPAISPLLAGGERLEWGAKTITSGGALALPRRLHAPGLLLAGECAGFVNVPTLKGVHYAIETGMLAAEASRPSRPSPIRGRRRSSGRSWATTMRSRAATPAATSIGSGTCARPSTAASSWEGHLGIADDGDASNT